jgi:hypothetical protein
MKVITKVLFVPQALTKDTLYYYPNLDKSKKKDQQAKGIIFYERYKNHQKK